MAGRLHRRRNASGLGAAPCLCWCRYISVRQARNSLDNLHVSADAFATCASCASFDFFASFSARCASDVLAPASASASDFGFNSPVIVGEVVAKSSRLPCAFGSAKLISPILIRALSRISTDRNFRPLSRLRQPLSQNQDANLHLDQTCDHLRVADSPALPQPDAEGAYLIANCDMLQIGAAR